MADLDGSTIRLRSAGAIAVDAQMRTSHPDVTYAGSPGTQSDKILDLVAAATGLRTSRAKDAGIDALAVQVTADDHEAYHPGATKVHVRPTGDRDTGRLPGVQLVGAHGAEVSKRVDVIAAAIHNGNVGLDLGELDLSYPPPLSSPWDPIHEAAHAWGAAARDPAE